MWSTTTWSWRKDVNLKLQVQLKASWVMFSLSCGNILAKWAYSTHNMSGNTRPQQSCQLAEPLWTDPNLYTYRVELVSKHSDLKSTGGLIHQEFSQKNHCKWGRTIITPPPVKFSPCDVLLDGMGLDAELEAELKAVGLMARHLLVHPVSQVKPQLLLLVATVPKTQIVILQHT